MSSKAYLPLLLLASLSAKPTTDAQVAPTWTDYSGEEPGLAEPMTIVSDADGGVYVGGAISGAAPGTSLGFVSRVGEGGAPAWTRDVEGPRGGWMRAVSVLTRAGDSVRVVFAEETVKWERAAYYVAAVAKSDGGAGAHLS